MASNAAPLALSVHSRSGQFTVSGVPMMTAMYRSSTSAVSFVRLDPALVAVSCEAIKSALLGELGLRDQWQGSVAISLHPVTEDDEPIDIVSTHYRNGWQYKLSVPEQVNRSRFTKAIVEVLLFEIVNRKAGARPAELPPWLVSGLAGHLEASSLIGLALEPESAILAHRRNADELAEIRDRFRSNKALTIDALNWPEVGVTTEDQNALYENCAHLMVYELLRLRNGRACMTEMLRRLHECLNWQTAFFHAFGRHFERLVDWDKWWSLRVVQLSQKEPLSSARQHEQWLLLESALRVADATANSVSAEPSFVNLQTVIREWNSERHLKIVEEALEHLRKIESSASGVYALLAREYALVLDDYLQSRRNPPPQHAGRNFVANRKVFAQTTIRRLDQLDARRKAVQSPR